MLRHLCKETGNTSIQRFERGSNHLHKCISRLAFTNSSKTDKCRTQSKKVGNEFNSRDKLNYSNSTFHPLENLSLARDTSFRFFSVVHDTVVDDVENSIDENTVFDKFSFNENIQESSMVKNDDETKVVTVNEGNEKEAPILHNMLNDFDQDNSLDSNEPQQSSTHKEQEDLLELNTDSAAKDKIKRVHNDNILEKTGSDVLNEGMAKAISSNNLSAAMKLLKESSQQKDGIRMEHLVRLLDLACTQRNLFFSNKILRRIIAKEKKKDAKMNQFNEDVTSLSQSTSNKSENQLTHPVSISTYMDLCQSIREYQGDRDARRGYLNSIIDHLFKHILNLDFHTYQKKILPVLFISVLAQPDYFLIHSSKIWRYMKLKQITCPNSVLEEMLKFSFLKAGQPSHYDRKRRDLPFDLVLDQLVQDGVRPNSQTMINNLADAYPYTDTEKTTRILKCIKHLYETKNDQEGDASTNNDSNCNGHEYRITSGTLEKISASAAKTGATDLVLLVWDLVDMMGYKPSEAMFENAIHAFMIAYRQDHNAFAVMAEMEGHGYVPSRALTQKIARSLSYSSRRVDNAYYILTNQTEGTKISTSSFNCILAASAKLGHVDNAFSTFDEFEERGLIPNSNSFSYLLEALSTDLKHLTLKMREKTQNAQEVNSTFVVSRSHLEAIEAIDSMLKQSNIEHTTYVIHQYANILIDCSELDRAKRFISDSVKKGANIQLRTFRLLCESYINEGNVESAREVCDLMRAVAENRGKISKDTREVVPLDLKEKLNNMVLKADSNIPKEKTMLDETDKDDDKSCANIDL